MEAGGLSHTSPLTERLAKLTPKQSYDARVSPCRLTSLRYAPVVILHHYQLYWAQLQVCLLRVFPKTRDRGRPAANVGRGITWAETSYGIEVGRD